MICSIPLRLEPALELALELALDGGLRTPTHSR